jgi:hypothetical protein
VTSSPTSDRDRVSALARTRPEEALELARSIEAPWFRCQALTSVALHANDARLRDSLIDEAFLAASQLTEPNRIVSVASWPLKVLVRHDSSERVRVETERLLGIANSEPSPVRRADSLVGLLGAVIAAGPGVVRPVVDALASACLQPLANGKRNKKGEYLLGVCIPGIHHVDPALAAHLLSLLPEARAQRVRREVTRVESLPIEEVMPWPHMG